MAKTKNYAVFFMMCSWPVKRLGQFTFVIAVERVLVPKLTGRPHLIFADENSQ